MLVYFSTSMRQLSLRSIAILLSLPGFSQTSPIQVGDGANTTTIREEFLVAYQRGEFLNAVALPPLTEVVAYGAGGFRQEFQDIGKAGLRFALIRPALPDLTLGVNNAVRQVRPPIYAIYTQSGIGVLIAGFPNLDTSRFNVPVSGSFNTFATGSYQTFDKGFGIFVWDMPPLSGGSDTRFNIAEPIYSRWNSIGFDQIGAPVVSLSAATSRFSTKANYQTFTNGAIYNITSGTHTGRVIFVRKAVQDLYEQNQGPAGFLGLPISEETIIANNRRRQSFEGGTMEYAVNGAPVLKNAILSVAVAAEDPIRLSTGQSRTLTAVLQTNAAEFVTDREVFWSTSNGRVVSIAGTGPSVTIRGVAGGSATITATSEGKTSNRITVFVASQCCSIGEGLPSQALSQTFLDAIQRNRITVKSPVATPVRRAGSGYLQEAIALPSGNRILILKADANPVAYLLSGATLTSFDALGGLTGPLGFPVSDVNSSGTQRFENGALAGSPLRLVSGPILSRWLALGADAGALGSPVGDRATAITFTGSQVSSQVFRSGALYEFAGGPLAGRALITVGPIAAKHAELGSAAGSIGAPLTDESLNAGAVRQEFEGAFLEYTAGTPVRVIDKERKPSLTITPSSLLPGARYRVSVGGFPASARLRFTQGSGTAADAFDLTTVNGSFVWESIVPSSARAGVVVLRATNANSPHSFAEASYTVRSLAELRPALTKLSGDAQAGAPATSLPVPIRVQLRDSSGNPLAGVALRFEASPSASILDSTAATNSEGIGEARLRLPPQSGIALFTVEAGGQIVTFTARATEQIPTDFPRITQSVDGNLGNSGSPLAQKGSLVAALAGVVRFYQQRGVAPSDNGLADTTILNSYLRAFCTGAADGTQICDGFLDAGAGADPQPNPFRTVDFASGAFSLSFPDPALASIREAIASFGPVIVGLNLSRNGQPAGVHFVTAFGILGDADLAISDPNPQFGFTRLSQYTSGFPAASANWLASPVAAIQILPRASSGAAFYAFSTAAFELFSPAAGCSRGLSWPATFASLTSTSSSANVKFQFCDGMAASYQASLPTPPFVFSVVSLTNPPAQSVVSGADPTAYRVSRSTSDAWALSPEQLSVNSTAILNAASFTPRLAAGTIISVFGNGLPLENGIDLNGQSLPIFFSNGFQLNSAIPSNFPPGPADLNIRSPFGQTLTRIDVAGQAPAIFLVNSRGAAALLNQDSTLNSPTNPAVRGQAIVLFSTGLGAVRLQSSGLSTLANPVSVVVNGRELVPFFAGLAPGFIGLYQVNAILPANLPPGLDQIVLLRSSGLDSNSGLISIR